MRFLVPKNTYTQNYISSDINIIYDIENDFYKVIANKYIKQNTIIIKEYPKINLFGEKDLDKGLQTIKKYIQINENELYPRKYNYTKTKMIKNIHKIINNSCENLRIFFKKYNKEEIEFYYAKYIYNTFEGNKFGPLTLPIMAKLNHSCNPNVIFNFDEINGHMILKTIKPITNGEEICCSYLMNKTINNHKEYLHDHYGFVCKC